MTKPTLLELHAIRGPSLVGLPRAVCRLPFGVSSRLNVDCYGALTKLLDKMLFPNKKDDPGDEGSSPEEV